MARVGRDVRRVKSAYGRCRTRVNPGPTLAPRIALLVSSDIRGNGTVMAMNVPAMPKGTTESVGNSSTERPDSIRERSDSAPARSAPTGMRARLLGAPLALPFGTSPLDSEEGRSFLQERLRLFARVMLWLGGFALAMSLGLRLVSRHSWTTQERGGIGWHAVGLVVTLLMWLSFRRGRLGIRTLLAFDGVGTFAVLSAFAAMGFHGASHAPERASLLLMMITLCTVITRAIIVPSTLLHTLAVTTIASALALALTYYAASTYRQLYDMTPMEATLYMSIWAVLGVTISCVASQSIFGLRVQVAQAQKLGQYSLGELIGEGGMGVVYKAQHALLRRPTAIKLLHSEMAGPHMLKRFEREVQMTARLTHPNTISIFDFGRTADGTFYYAMEYLDGINLEQLVSRYGPQDCRRVVRILEQVAGSLSEAHQIGLVHRDIKPANVILCSRGGLPDVAKVVDFGLVKHAGSSTEPDPSLTGINTIIGTPLYLAPEGITSPDTVDARSDLYALGALGYYLIAGVPVFTAATVVEICVMHANMQPVPPSLRAGRDVPAGLEALILRCLAKAPQDRPQTAEDFLQELAAAGVAPWPRDEAHAWWAAHEPSPRAVKRTPSLGVNATTNPDTVIVNYGDRDVAV